MRNHAQIVMYGLSICTWLLINNKPFSSFSLRLNDSFTDMSVLGSLFHGLNDINSNPFGLEARSQESILGPLL